MIRLVLSSSVIINHWLLPQRFSPLDYCFDKLGNLIKAKCNPLYYMRCYLLAFLCLSVSLFFIYFPNLMMSKNSAIVAENQAVL